MSTCVRGCTHWRRHRTECPVEDRGSGAWIPWTADVLPVEDSRVTDRGTVEVWRVCNGCAPRKAIHGCLCEQCHLRISGWLGIGPGALAWSYDWIALDLIPSQSAAPSGKISRGKPTPPAALNLHAHQLRCEIAEYLGGWLGAATHEFGLVGPDWWSWRDAELRIPRNQKEVSWAAQYLLTWLDKAEEVPELIQPMWDEAADLIKRVQAVAPWEPMRTRLPT